MPRVATKSYISLILAMSLFVNTYAASQSGNKGPKGDLSPVTLMWLPNQKPIILVKDSKPLGEIVKTTNGYLTNAAVNDLQKFILASTGAQLPIVAKTSGISAIIIGDSAVARKNGINTGKLPTEGFTIQTITGKVFIIANDDAGRAWGINEFLERFVDVRFYWPEIKKSKELLGTSIIKKKNLSIKPVSLSDSPVFRKRHRWPSGGIRIGDADIVAMDRHLRSYNSWSVQLIVHAPHDWSYLYTKTRPEIFQKRSDGSREFTMLCYGNPLTLKTYLQEIEYQLKQIKEKKKIDPKRLITDGKNITVSPNDLAVACRCEYCQKLWQKNGGQYGTAAKVIAEFVRKLALEVKKRWSDMTIVYLPYKNYTYAPKNLKFPGNVEIQICGMPGLAQYKDSVINAAEQKNIDAWIKISGRKIQNWHYSCWPADKTRAAYLFPHIIKKYYMKNRKNIVGSFINGVKNHFQRQHISLYAWLKCLWNPDFEVNAAIEEYCKRMYGPAVKEMREIVRRQCDGWEQNKWKENTFSAKAIYEESYPRKDVVKMEKLLKLAFEKAKGDKLTLKRLNYYAKPLQAFFAESKQYADGTGKTILFSQKVPENPIIDGKLDDKVWKSATAVNFVKAMNKEQPKPNFPTSLKCVWTWDGVTFGFHMLEPTPNKLCRKINSPDDSNAWWDDNVEIFLDVLGKRTEYYQFIINPNNAIWDAKGKNISWKAHGVKVKSYVGENYWELEVYIPNSAFKNILKPHTGSVWYSNFTRHRVTDKKNREYQRLNTTFQGPSNNMMAFGPIKFVE